MPDTADEKNRIRLGEQIAARRAELGLSVSKAARMATVDRATWTAAEAGTRTLAPHNRRGVETVLQWGSGSIDAILIGVAAGPTPRVGSTSITSVPRRPSTAADRRALRQEARRIAALPIPAEDRLTLVLALIDRIDAGDVEPARPAASAG